MQPQSKRTEPSPSPHVTEGVSLLRATLALRVIERVANTTPQPRSQL